ncbi:hypothetical protein SDC9_159178 [bioreactor metagenome]|uniref:Uncharacterized protein n=1 Tax=bioreactor metagenome TaxID=1076179 RepID=A0A645FD41_9ZZZZ
MALSDRSMERILPQYPFMLVPQFFAHNYDMAFPAKGRTFHHGDYSADPLCAVAVYAVAD